MLLSQRVLVISWQMKIFKVLHGDKIILGEIRYLLSIILNLKLCLRRVAFYACSLYFINNLKGLGQDREKSRYNHSFKGQAKIDSWGSFYFFHPFWVFISLFSNITCSIFLFCINSCQFWTNFFFAFYENNFIWGAGDLWRVTGK